MIDRHIDPDALRFEVDKITTQPIQIVYDTPSDECSQKAGFSLLSPGGALVVTRPSLLGALGEDNAEGKRVVREIGIPMMVMNRETGLSLYSKLGFYLEEGIIKVCNADA